MCPSWNIFTRSSAPGATLCEMCPSWNTFHLVQCLCWGTSTRNVPLLKHFSLGTVPLLGHHCAKCAPPGTLQGPLFVKCANPGTLFTRSTALKGQLFVKFAPKIGVLWPRWVGHGPSGRTSGSAPEYYFTSGCEHWHTTHTLCVGGTDYTLVTMNLGSLFSTRSW